MMLALAAGWLALRADPPAYPRARVAWAFEVFKGNDPHREEILKKLHDESPTDGALCFYYGYAVLVRASAMEAGPKRTALIKEARGYVLQAQKSGYVQPLVELALGTFHEDGSFNVESFSPNRRVDACIKAAEKAFATRKYEDALRAYQDALAIDPTSYSATLFLGDVYFATNRPADAVRWFDKAIALNPNLETAHRYRGDALEKLGRSGEALDSFVAAVVADPYNRLPWNALTVVAQQRGYAVRFRAAPLPKADIKMEKGGCSIILPNEPGVLTVAYGTMRAAWIEKHRPKAVGDPHYRQSLEEEREVLGLVLESALAMAKSPEQKANPDREVALTETSFNELRQIANAGLLEPHILLTRANADLAQDYGPYREKHREQIAAYLRRFYLGLE